MSNLFKRKNNANGGVKKRLALRISLNEISFVLFGLNADGAKVILNSGIEKSENKELSISKIKEILKSYKCYEENIETIIVTGPEFGSLMQMDSPGKDLERTNSLKALSWQMAEKGEFNANEGEIEGYAINEANENGLLRPMWWAYAVNGKELKKLLIDLDSIKLNVIKVVNESFSFVSALESQSADRATAYLSIGEEYSSLSFCSLSSGLLFSKQLDWTNKDFADKSKIEKFVLDLQRNLDYFDRRLSSIATNKIIVNGIDENDFNKWKNSCEGFISINQETLNIKKGLDGFDKIIDSELLIKIFLAANLDTEKYRVNIFRPYAKELKKVKNKQVIALSMAGAFAICMSLFYSYTESLSNQLNIEAEKNETVSKKQEEQINILIAKQAGPNKELLQIKENLDKEISRKKALLDGTGLNMTEIDGNIVLSQLEDAIIKSNGAWINNVTISSQSSSWIIGNALSKEKADIAASNILNTDFAKSNGFWIVKVNLEDEKEGIWQFTVSQNKGAK